MNCMQVSYSQNAFIYTCGKEFANDDRCGTYLEVKTRSTRYPADAVVLRTKSTRYHAAVVPYLDTRVPTTKYRNVPYLAVCSGVHLPYVPYFYILCLFWGKFCSHVYFFLRNLRDLNIFFLSSPLYVL